MTGRLTIAVGITLPDADRRKMGRTLGGDPPLIGAIVGDAIHSDLAGAPGLAREPLDAFINILRLLRAADSKEACRAPRPAGFDADERVAIGNPFLRIRYLPALIEIRRIGDGVRIVTLEDFPSCLIAILPGKTLHKGRRSPAPGHVPPAA